MEERTPLEDESLIVKAQHGDASAFGQLVERYQDAVFRGALLVLQDASEAEDAAQEAFMKAYRALHRFHGGALRPWLVKIAVNEALNRRKARKRRMAVAQRIGTAGETLEWALDETLIDRERARLLRAALEALREQERVLIYLRYFLMLSEKELAGYFGCAPGTVKSRLHRALARLREVVIRRYPGLLVETG